MELKQIKELMAAMGRTGTKRVVVKKEGFDKLEIISNNFDKTKLKDEKWKNAFMLFSED